VTTTANIYPVSVVRDLGVFIDSGLGAATHVRRTVSSCFGALRQLRHQHLYVLDDCLRSLVVSLSTWISWFVSPTFLVATVWAHLHPNCCTFRHTVLLPSAVARFRLLHPSFGTPYLQLSSPRLLCLFFANV